MKVSILGSDSTALCQINSIREGMGEYGHMHTYDVDHPDTSFVFIGNPPYDKYLDLARKKNKKVIFNVLDICFHCSEINDIIKDFKENLPLASKVTTISHTVKRQLKEFCDIDSEVIYYPMKNVRFTGEKKYPKFKAALVGRVADPNKRAGFAINALLKAGYKEDEIAIVGPEYFGFGNRCGIVSENVLNDIYNSVDYVFMPSKTEGIGLSAIEAALCGAIPIVLPDLSTFNEFWIQSPLGLHYQQINSIESAASLIQAIDSDIKWKNEIKQDLIGYGELFFRQKFDKKQVAKRILDIYHSIPNLI
jgi:glycosyltransferase involved in cell wall biosynthesis